MIPLRTRLSTLRHARAYGLVLAITVAAACGRDEAPNLILTGGKVFTADSTRPWAQAVAVRGNRIVAVGTDAEIERLAGSGTRTVPLEGRVVVPGFNDAHAHIGAGIGGSWVAIDPSPTPDPAFEVVLDSLVAAARRTPSGTWIRTAVGGRVLEDARASRRTLDRLVPDHPVWIEGWSGHGAILNSAALRATGLDTAPDPLGGWLARGSGGRPTGRIDEYAKYAAERALRLARGDSVTIEAARAVGDEAVRLGITTLQDMATSYSLAEAHAIAGAGALPVRHRVIPFPMTTAAGRSTEWNISAADTVLGPLTRASGVKWVLDGTPIERLALVRKSYTDRVGWYGRLNFPADTVRAMLAEAVETREQLLLHAVGDSTIAVVLSLMPSVAPDTTWRRLRLRLEHADNIGADQLDAVRRLGIVIVANPSHLMLPQVLGARWGGERLGHSQLLRSLLDANIPVAIGSDGPMNPFLNLMFATMHPGNPDEALTREQAVIAYTRGSAFAEHAEGEKGILAPGMLADLAVLSQDIFTVPPDALPATTSVLTIVGGRTVHDATSAPSASATSRR